MRVLLLSSSFPGVSNVMSGIFVSELAVDLTQSGCRVAVVAPKTCSEDPDFEQTKEGVDVHRFTYWGFERKAVSASSSGIPLVSTLSFLLMMFLSSIRARGLKKFDVVHAYWLIPGGFVAWLFGRIFGTPVVVTAAGSDVNDWSYRKFAGKGVQFVARRVDRILALGQSLKDRLVHLGVNPERIVVVMGDKGIKSSDFHPGVRESGKNIRAELAIPSTSVVAVYSGRHAQPKRLELVLKAMKKIPGLHLIATGEGPDNLGYRETASAEGVAERVHWVGVVEREKLPSYVGAADFVVYPTDHEGIPNGIREAMSIGLPSVASRAGGIPDVIKDGYNGFLVENTVDSFERRMSEMVDNPQERSRLASNALEFARKELSQEVLTQKIIATYQNAAKDRNL